MWINNTDIKGIRKIARRLGLLLVEQRLEKSRVQVRIYPKAGKKAYRAISCNGKAKVGLCLHAQYAFLSEVLAAYPDAYIKTWVTGWNYTLFVAGARAWTDNEVRDRAHLETCDCTPEMIQDALRNPEELRKLRETRNVIKERTNNPERNLGRTG